MELLMSVRQMGLAVAVVASAVRRSATLVHDAASELLLAADADDLSLVVLLHDADLAILLDSLVVLLDLFLPHLLVH